MDHKSLEYLFNQNELNLRPLNDLNCLRTMITLLAIISVRKLNGCKVVTQLMKIMVTVHKRKRTKFNVYNFKDEIFIREEECNGPAHTHKKKKKKKRKEKKRLWLDFSCFHTCPPTTLTSPPHKYHLTLSLSWPVNKDPLCLISF